MNRRLLVLSTAACFACVPAAGHIRLKGSAGKSLYRPDFANVQLVLNDKTVPGMGNAAISSGSLRTAML